MEESASHQVDIHVGGMVRARRKQLGMSQQSLGEAVGITFQQVQKYERGTNRVSASKLFEIARTLNVSPSYFFNGLDQSDDSDLSRSEVTAQAFLRSAEGIELSELFLKLTPERRRAVTSAVRTFATS